MFSIRLGVVSSGNFFFFFAMNIALKSCLKSFTFTNLHGALKVYQSGKKYLKARYLMKEMLISMRVVLKFKKLLVLL